MEISNIPGWLGEYLRYLSRRSRDKSNNALQKSWFYREVHKERKERREEQRRQSERRETDRRHEK